MMRRRPEGADGCIVVMGDSVAQGQGDPDPDGGWLGWAGRLAAQLCVPRDQVLNTAEPGATFHDVAHRQLPQVRNEWPQLVVVCCGMNDALKGFDRAALARSLTEVLRWAATRCATAVIPVPIPPLLTDSPMSQVRQESILRRIAIINEELSGQTGRFDAICLPAKAAAAISPRQFWSADGIHLNASGHTVVADALARATQQLMSRRSLHTHAEEHEQARR